MTKRQKDLRDLRYLKANIQVDMSPEAITGRLVALDELCKLAKTLGLPDIEYYRTDLEWMYTEPGNDEQ